MDILQGVRTIRKFCQSKYISDVPFAAQKVTFDYLYTSRLAHDEANSRVG